MTNIIIYVAIAIAVVGSIFGYLKKTEYDAAQAEREKIRIETIAKSNQNIAERRVRDATFDKFDAAELCRRAGLEWMQSDGKSFCQ